MDFTFSVKRFRISATQGNATVYLNGVELVSFGDAIMPIKDGRPFYGENIGGWASAIPDGDFVHGVLFHPYDNIYNYSDKVRKILKGEFVDEHSKEASNTRFLSERHLENFREAVSLIPDAVNRNDRRISSYYGASLFLLTGLEETWAQLRRFCTGYIDCGSMLDEVTLSTGEQIVVRLAGNLYNGGFWVGTPGDLASDLDDHCFQLCLSALAIRRARAYYDYERGIVL